MARRRPRTQQTPSQLAVTPWYKKVWFIVTLIGAGIGAVLMHGPTMLSNVENLPAAYTKVSDKFSGWYYEDDEWTGIWSASPGYADQEDMQFSDVDLILEIKSINGQIDGVIATKKICEALPWDFILIGGSISGNKADILAWDIVGGKKTNFAKLTLERSGVIMTVSPTEGRVEWFPQKARIGLHPQSDQAEDNKIFSDFCGRRKEALSSQRHSERKRY